jgi:3-isopropylmalate dehydrogenase
VGAGAYLERGDPLPLDTLERLREADAILLGAMGLPSVRWPDGTEMTPQIDLREQLDLYFGLRPIRLYHPSHSPLARPGDIDFVLVRENTEGLFFSRKAAVEAAADVRDTMRISRPASERLFRKSFALARERRRRVTLVDKANVLPSMAFFRSIFDEVAAEFPDVETERVYVDAMALYLVQCPERYDVVVTENMFGDILSDLAAGLVGGMGMAPSADIGDRFAVFQPSHGTAPDLAGKGLANPVATILSAALMLDWLKLPAPAEAIRAAVDRTLADGTARTADLRGAMTTREMTDRILGAMEPAA